jgi:hypothetical protein
VQTEAEIEAEVDLVCDRFSIELFRLTFFHFTFFISFGLSSVSLVSGARRVLCGRRRALRRPAATLSNAACSQSICRWPLAPGITRPRPTARSLPRAAAWPVAAPPIARASGCFQSYSGEFQEQIALLWDFTVCRRACPRPRSHIAARPAAAPPVSRASGRLASPSSEIQPYFTHLWSSHGHQSARCCRRQGKAHDLAIRSHS